MMNLLMAPVRLGLSLPMRIARKLLLATVGSALRQIVQEEAGHYLKDIEWRYKQARDLVNEVNGAGPAEPGLMRQVTAEDFNTLRHQLTGYTLTPNVDNTGAALAGSFRWQALHVVYGGVDYTIVNGATSLKYVWFDNPSTTLVCTDTKPTLGTTDVLLFINNSGTPVVAASDSNTSLPTAVASLSIDSGSLATAVSTSITTAQTTATTGVTNAATAQTQANTGVTNAATAQTQANLGVANAATALSTANTGVTNAATAQTTANTGVTNAATALTAANNSIVGPTRLSILSHVLY